MKIVVTGSLGHIGKPLTEDLVERGHSVTVVSSNPDRRAAIEALGAMAAIGSLEDGPFLTTTFAGADAVFTMVPPNYAETDLVAYYSRVARAYVQAIRQTGVRRVVNLSSYGAHLDRDTGPILGAHYAENILDTLPDGTITHLRAGYFYYNLFGFQAMIREAGFMGANYGEEDRIALVAPADIAAVAAEELTRPATSQTVRYVASDERIASEIARVLGTAIGKPDLTWKVLTSAQMRDGLAQQGMPAHLIDSFVAMGDSLRRGALMEDYDQNRPTLGPIKLETFARDFAAAF